MYGVDESKICNEKIEEEWLMGKEILRKNEVKKSF